ncbi:MAG: hypothetical protein MJZ30_11415 [Paludibacteraceae bacterium]|nr:hypothetical protein [Paludibacteraceae bacterium]
MEKIQKMNGRGFFARRQKEAAERFNGICSDIIESYMNGWIGYLEAIQQIGAATDILRDVNISERKIAEMSAHVGFEMARIQLQD